MKQFAEEFGLAAVIAVCGSGILQVLDMVLDVVTGGIV